MFSKELNPLNAPPPIDSIESDIVNVVMLVKFTHELSLIEEPPIVNLTSELGI